MQKCISQVFMAQRALGGKHGGLWEFPGGKVEPGEDDQTALVREVRIFFMPLKRAPSTDPASQVREELGVGCTVKSLLAEGQDGSVRLTCYEVFCPPGDDKTSETTRMSCGTSSELPAPLQCSFAGEPRCLEHQAVRWIPVRERIHPTSIRPTIHKVSTPR
jgi:hypothetical protein